MACGLIVIYQRDFLYVPFSGPVEPTLAGAYGYARKSFTAADGQSIPYWEFGNTNSPHTILYLHGNGGGLHAFVGGLNTLMKAGYRVVAMEYRGYPGAPPFPTQQKIVSDAVQLFDIVKASSHQSIVLWGYSLGSAVAAQVAAQRHAAAVVMEAPVYSVVSRAQEIYFLFPARLLMLDQYRSDEAIPHIKSPIYIMHGGADFVVPDSHGRRLAALAPDRTTFKFYPDASHYDLGDYGAYDAAFAWINGIR